MMGGMFGDDEPTPQERHLRALEEFGQCGPLTTARCQITPEQDAITVRRWGPENLPTTLVLLGTRSGSVHLSPFDARRIASAMLTAADEADGASPLRFATPDDAAGLT